MNNKIIKTFYSGFGMFDDIHPYVWKWYYQLRGCTTTLIFEMDQFLTGIFVGGTYTLTATKSIKCFQVIEENEVTQ